MKVYYPTMEEMMNPIEYIERIYREGASEYGCVKLKPPAEFRPPCAFDMNQTKKMPTRY